MSTYRVKVQNQPPINIEADGYRIDKGYVIFSTIDDFSITEVVRVTESVLEYIINTDVAIRNSGFNNPPAIFNAPTTPIEETSPIIDLTSEKPKKPKEINQYKHVSQYKQNDEFEPDEPIEKESTNAVLVDRILDDD